jgi:hypothetical protein
VDALSATLSLILDAFRIVVWREATMSVNQSISLCSAVLAVVVTATGAGAERPAHVLELETGWAGFPDDGGSIDHWVLGAAARFYLSPRVSVGPELVYMIGPRTDRDLIFTGNLTFDLLGPTDGRGRRATPYLVLGGGLFTHREDFSGRTFSSTEGAFTGGGGVRFWLNDRVSIAGDLRAGWELHLRTTLSIGLRLP